MPVTVCWAAKGGSGTTVVTATLALSCPNTSLLIDLAGELPAMLGVERPASHGIADWLRSDAPPAALDDLAIEVDRTTRLIPRGTPPPSADSPRWSELVEWLAGRLPVFVDAGTGVPPSGSSPATCVRCSSRDPAISRCSGCRASATVPTASCSSMSRGAPCAHSTSSVPPVLPSSRRVSHDPAIQRAVDSGLLRGRLPRLLARELRGAA